MKHCTALLYHKDTAIDNRLFPQIIPTNQRRVSERLLTNESASLCLEDHRDVRGQTLRLEDKVRLRGWRADIAGPPVRGPVGLQPGPGLPGVPSQSTQSSTAQSEFSTLIGPGLTRLCSHWFDLYHSVATAALLCHKDTAQGTHEKNPREVFLAFRCVFMA